MTCTPNALNGNIGAGDDYFFLEGHRKYVKYYWSDYEECGDHKELGYYIPRGLGPAKKSRSIAEKFNDPITTHRVCMECMKKILAFAGASICSKSAYEQKHVLEWDHMKTQVMKSQLEYVCRCCVGEISKGSSYVRVGYHEKVCLHCFEIAKQIHGVQFK